MEILLYVLAGGIGFILAKLISPPSVSPFFQDVVMASVKQGKRVVIAIDNDATIFEMYDNRIRITRGIADFTMENVNVTDLGNSKSVQSLGSNKSDH